jgi:competence protein ComEC
LRYLPDSRCTSFLVSTPKPCPGPNTIGQLQVTFIDVGQGDSIFIQTPEGQTALINDGADNGNTLAYLQKQSITHLNLVIASRPHADHIGGLVQVMQVLSVDSVWTSGSSTTTGIYERFLDVILEKKIPYNEAQTNSVIAFGSLNFAVLYSATQAKNLNNTSRVLHLLYGDTSFLFTGDAEVPVETQLVSTVKDQLRSTVLKIGHHGSSTSLSPAFLGAIQPTIAVYSAGRNNAYGHPDGVRWTI